MNYGIVQPAMAEVLARILPPLEVVIGIVLLSGRFRKSISLTAAALLSAFFALMLWAYLRDLKIACGCFAGGEPIGPRTLLRDGVLLAVSLYLAISTWRVPQKPRSGCLP